MQRVLILAIVLIAGAAAFIYFSLSRPTSTPEQRQASDPPAPEIREELVAAAREHINRLTAAPEEVIRIERADHFVTAQQLLSLPKEQTEGRLQLEAVNATDQAALIPDAPLSLEDRGDAAPQPASPVTIAVEVATSLAADESRNSSNSEIPPRSDQLLPASRESLQVIRGMMPKVKQSVKLQELLDQPNQDGRVIFYIHAVQEGDDQGLWGIIQRGLTRTFAEGIELQRLNQKVVAEIPPDADEKLRNDLSSFLGRMLQDKVRRTYVYNYRKGVLGDNPDLIEPGQQLIVVTFTEDELVRIYHHFTTQ